MKYKQYLDRISKEIRRRELNDLESKLIHSLESSLTYEEIAVGLNYNSSYIADIARELFGLIGQKHRVKVTRKNLFTVLDTYIDGEPETDFFVCHNIKDTVFAQGVIQFNKDAILFSVSLFWKLDVATQSLILKTKYPVVLKLEDLTLDKLGTTLINLSRRKQVSGDAILELLKILNNYDHD